MAFFEAILLVTLFGLAYLLLFAAARSPTAPREKTASAALPSCKIYLFSRLRTMIFMGFTAKSNTRKKCLSSESDTTPR